MLSVEQLAAIHARSITPAWSAKAFQDLLALSGVWVEVEADEGFVLMQQAGDEAEVLTLAVVPEARQQGRGRALMETALARSRARGIAKVFLEVAADNTAARALYRRMGFVQTGQRRGYYARADGPPVDALLLTLNLSGALP